MLTATQLRGLRPHELLVLAALCGMDWQRIDPDCSEDALTALREVASQHAITIVDLQTLLTALFPDADSNELQCRSAFRHVGLFLFHRREQQTFRADSFGAPLR